MLHGKVAVVTGASRGAGRGVALALGEAGATVYVTGRSVRGQVTGTRRQTIEDTAEAITALGGLGIPVRVDHTCDEQVQALFERVEAEQGRLDILVNSAWGGSEIMSDAGRPFWERSHGHWETMFNAGVRATLMSSTFAAPYLVRRGAGLIANVSYWPPDGKYWGFLHYYVAKAALNTMAQAMGEDLRPYGVAAVALSPGWMRTEIVLDTYGVTEQTWRSAPELAPTQSPQFLGRAVAALAADPHVMAKTGQVLHVADLAREYGFTDIT